jgi:hypothetical protein
MADYLTGPSAEVSAQQAAEALELSTRFVAYLVSLIA